MVIALLHILAFIEFPSSLVLTTDIRQDAKRINLPCGLTETIEAFCLLVLAADVILKVGTGYGKSHHTKFYLSTVRLVERLQ